MRRCCSHQRLPRQPSRNNGAEGFPRSEARREACRADARVRARDQTAYFSDLSARGRPPAVLGIGRHTAFGAIARAPRMRAPEATSCAGVRTQVISVLDDRVVLSCSPCISCCTQTIGSHLVAS